MEEPTATSSTCSPEDSGDNDGYGDSDYDDDDMFDDEEEPGSSYRCSPDIEDKYSTTSEYRIIDADAAVKLQEESTESIQAILGCKSSAAKSLLMHFRWDKEALLSTMADKGPEHLYSVAGVANGELQQTSSKEGGDAFMCCQICFCETEVSACTTMDCGHAYCNTCWHSHCQAKIQEGDSRELR
eukprot:gene30282-35270_t